LILAVRWLDIYWYVKPAFSARPAISVLDLSLPLLMAGVALFFFGRAAAGNAGGSRGN
jgi:hypothetical protein